MHFLERECTPESRTLFLRFATGRLALSPADRDGWLKVHVRQEWTPEKLPEPHTCVPRMDLAPHVSQAQLTAKMKQVLCSAALLCCAVLCSAASFALSSSRCSRASFKAIGETVGGGMFAV